MSIMDCNIVYAIHKLNKMERTMVEQQLRDCKYRILWQQFYDAPFSFRHYGVDLGDGSIIHFRGEFDLIQPDAWIQRTSDKEFARDRKIYRAKDIKYAFDHQTVKTRALSMVGSDFGGYHILCNNCEHFANWCANGKKISQQVLLRL